MKKVLPALIGIVFTLWASIAVAEPQPGKRVALIIGNAAYASFGKLDNPSNDAEDVAAVLRQIGFTVIEGRDLSKRDMDRRLAQFSRAASDAETAVVYYAGHGLQYQNQNYLVPTDAQLKDGFDIPFETTSVDSVIGALDNARGARIMILDACRNLPLAEGVKRGSGTGLARVVGRDGLIIAYATQSNQVAFDGNGRNSPYAEALAKSLGEAGLEVGQVFQRVAVAVKKATQGKQLPEFSRSYADEVFLNRAETDSQAWIRLRTSNVVADLSAFIEKFPTSFLADAARIRIQLLENQARYAEQEIENKRQEERRAQERLVWARREEEQHRREQAQLSAEKSRREEEQNQAELGRLMAQRQDEEAKREAQRREESARQEQARLAAERAARMAAAEIMRREETMRAARAEAEKAARLAAAEQKRRDDEARQEQARLESEKAARLAAAEQQRRDETARQEQARLESEKAARLAAAEQKRREDEARQEQARLDAEKAARVAAAEQKRREDAARQEQARVEAEKAARVAAAEQKRREDEARQEQARAEAEKAARVAAAEQKRREDEVRQEQARLTAEKAARLAAVEQARLESEKAARVAAAESQRREEMAKQETARQEMAKQEQARLEAEKIARIVAAEQQRHEETLRQEQARLTATPEVVRMAALTRDDEAKRAGAVKDVRAGGFALSPEPTSMAGAVADRAEAQPEPAAPQTAYASLDLTEMNKPKAATPGHQTELYRAVQRRLSDLGCFKEPPEASWGKHSAAALENFHQSAQRIEQAKTGLNRSIRIIAAMPDQTTLDELNSYSGRICPVYCPTGTEQKGEVCVKVTCPSGHVLSENVCLPRKAAPVEAEAPARIRKAGRPSDEGVDGDVVAKPAKPAKPAKVVAPAPAPRAPKVVSRPEPKVVHHAPKPTVKVVQPLRAAPRVPALSTYVRAAPVRATAASAPSFSPAEIGAVRAMSRMP